MPLRTVTLKDGTVCTRMITNIHPDGTEFLPEEFELPYNETTEIAYGILAHCLDLKLQQEAAKQSKKN